MSDYVLGTDDEELNRLHRQHELWAEQAREIWGRAFFKGRRKILDLGCGPGFTTVEMARFVGATSAITAVDASDRYLAYLRQNAAATVPGTEITTCQSFLEKLDLPEKDFEAAYCRWLMIFVPDVPGALKAVHRHLKPGAVFALQEYVAYETMNLLPVVPAKKDIIDAIFRSWKDQGGDPNRAQVLPKLLEENGFRVREIRPILRAARPGEPLWEWPDQFYRVHLPKLVSTGYLSADKAREFLKAWEAAGTNPGSFFLGPSMLDIVAERI